MILSAVELLLLLIFTFTFSVRKWWSFVQKPSSRVLRRVCAREPIIMKKFSLIGTPGSGKSFISRTLCKKLKAGNIELDELSWLPGWKNPPKAEFTQKLGEQLAANEFNGWVVDGNYMDSREQVWKTADVIVWLDYSIWLVLYQLIKRTFNRCWTGAAVCNGNVETFSGHLFSKNSLLKKTIRMHMWRRREWPKMFGSKEWQKLHPGVQVVRLTSHADAEQWLKSVLNSRIAV